MADSHEQKHPYHLVDPSPWPIIGSGAALLLALGTALFMHGHGPLLLVVGLLGVLATMFFWWRDVIRESIVRHLHTPVVKIGLRYGMTLFIASEVMFFVAFFWAFFDASLFPKEATLGVLDPEWQALGMPWDGDFPPAGGHVGIWPPQGVITFDPFDLPFMNTLILLLSGCTVTWAHHAIQHGDNRTGTKALAITVALGLLFTLLQAYEYSHAAFSFGEGIYPSTFYMATGFHGFHVIVGTLFLAVCLWRAARNQFTPERHFGFEAAAWYWHFVDVVWLFLFICVYWWKG